MIAQAPRRLKARACWRLAAVAAVMMLQLPHAPVNAAQIFSSRYQDVETRARCQSRYTGERFKNCTSTAYVRPLALEADDANYRMAFDAWNSGLDATAQWRLVNGGFSTDGNFKIDSFLDDGPCLPATDFDAIACQRVGGMVVKISYTGRPHYWSQGLFVNYIIDQGLQSTPFFEMDNGESSTSPLYPFQRRDWKFFDRPRGPWPNASFDAFTFLSDTDFETRTLTIYSGVGWGFKLSAEPDQTVPEPGTWVMMVLGSGMVGAAIRRRRTAFHSA